jgi:cyclophilin family peptidyl-prolyl cis-trans isomerase
MAAAVGGRDPGGQQQQQQPAVLVVFETSMGNVEFELYTSHAPKTCFNFSRLADMGYYNDTIFHRVIKDFVSDNYAMNDLPR